MPGLKYFHLNYQLFSLIVLLFITPCGIKAQNPITFVITHTPSYTPEDDTLYLITSIDDWAIAVNPSRQFKLYPDGYYRLTMDIGNTKKFEYKINRGSWNKVEGNNWGDFLANRRFVYNDSLYEIRIEIASWQDLHDTVFPPVKVIVNTIPENTPQDAEIYIAGTFNGWMNNDPAYRLIKGADGSFVGEIQAGLENFNYKFTRGSWESVEGRWDGGMRSNRTYEANQQYNKKIIASIYSWNDLTDGMVWFKVLYLVLFIQCIIMLALLVRYVRIRILSLISILLCFVFFAKFINADFGLLHKLPYLYLLPPLVYSFFVPWMFTWFKAYLGKTEVKICYAHFLPMLPMLWYIHYLNTPVENFYLMVVNNEFTGFFFLSYGYGLIIHIYFSYKLRKLIVVHVAEISNLIYQLYRTLWANCLFSVMLYCTVLLAYFQGVEEKLLVDWLDHLIWIGVGVVVFYYEWFFLSGILTKSVNNDDNLKKELVGYDKWKGLKIKLTELMVEKNIYANPDLTLSDVAVHLGTNTHYVSKLINEGFNKSYNDYINAYRVNAFIEAIKADTEDNTFLYYAFKVGFNSKSAFNRAFKKVTNTTPSDYFSDKKEVTVK